MLCLVFKGMLVSSKPGRLKYTHCVLIKGVMEGRQILLLPKVGVVAQEIRILSVSHGLHIHALCSTVAMPHPTSWDFVLTCPWDQPARLRGNEVPFHTQFNIHRVSEAQYQGLGAFAEESGQRAVPAPGP